MIAFVWNKNSYINTSKGCKTERLTHAFIRDKVGTGNPELFSRLLNGLLNNQTGVLLVVRPAPSASVKAARRMQAGGRDDERHLLRLSRNAGAADYSIAAPSGPRRKGVPNDHRKESTLICHSPFCQVKI